MPSYKDLGIPSGTAAVDVRVFNIGAPGESVVLASAFMTPIIPGHEASAGPMYAFLIEHKATKKRIMFDLGPRKDSENSASAVLNFFDKIGRVLVQKDIIEQLVYGGIQPEDIDTVIWSHTHFDHTGDMSKFLRTMELFIGQGTVRYTYPTKPDSSLLESDFTYTSNPVSLICPLTIDSSGRKVTEVIFDKSHLKFGGLRAVDFFGDGSLYLLDVPGHWHVLPNVVSPVPENLLYEDPKTSRESLAKLRTFDANDDVFVLIADDASVGELVEKYPAKLNDWKEKGWKEQGILLGLFEVDCDE